jgi:carbon-monoxide dehydrogenase large subunit
MQGELASALMGRSVWRLEDSRLLRGAGRFVDDLDLPGLLHATFVRSPIAHGRIRRVDAAKARALAGVQAVLTHAELRHVLACDRIPLALPLPAIRFHVDPYALARDEACYVGEPIALIVADSRRIAEDAAALVGLELEPLPAVVDPRAGLERGAPRARLDCPDNLVAHWMVQYGDVEAAFAAAAHRTSEHFRLHKGGGHSLETRAVLARYDAGDDMLIVWDSTQMPHKSKRVLVEALGLSEERVRVIAPDVGGGFGPKNPFYPEELAIPAAALALKRPIKWIEDRRESFTATNHEREQDWDIEVAVDGGGKLAPSRRPASRCRRTLPPISSAPMCCRRIGSKSRCA